MAIGVQRSPGLWCHRATQRNEDAEAASWHCYKEWCGIQLKAANDQIGQAVEDLPNRDTLAHHGPQLQQLKEQVAKAQAAMSQLAAELNCPG